MYLYRWLFTVDYHTCKGEDCPDHCAVYGTDSRSRRMKRIKDIKLKKDKLEWEIRTRETILLSVP